MRFLWMFLLVFSTVKNIDAKVERKENTLRINFLQGAPKFLHPHLMGDTNSASLYKSMSEGLTRINLKGKVELALAKKIKISKCRTVYTIYLRSSKWANGEELTADHFVNTWKFAMRHKSRCAHVYHFFPIKNAKKVFQGELPLSSVGVSAPEKNKIVIHLEHPTPYFTQLLAGLDYAPLWDISYLDPVVYNGPFILKSFYPSKGISLEKNPFYWDAKNVRLDKIFISFVGDEKTELALFQQGKLDFVGGPFSDLPYEFVQKSPEIQSKKACSIFWLHMNIDHPMLRSKSIRKALSLSLNRKYIENYVLPHAEAASTILPKELSCINSKLNSYSKEKIVELFHKGLSEIGCTLEDFVLPLSYSSNKNYEHLAEYLKHVWENFFSIKVTLDKSEWNTFFTKLRTKNFAMGGTTRFTLYEDPLYFLDYFTFAKNNYSKWEDPTFQKWINLAKQTTSEKKRKRYLSEAEKILSEECPVISIYTHKHLYLCHPSLQNFYPSRLAYSDFRWAYFVK